MFLSKSRYKARRNENKAKGQRCYSRFIPRVETLEHRCLLSATDVVMEWNAVAIEAAKEDHAIGAPGLQFGPTRTSRALAIESIAVYDSVTAIDRSCSPFLVSDVHASAGASIEAAAAQAAHD